MLSENIITSINGPSLSNNSAIGKDNGIYLHTISPTFSVTGTFKKSSTPVNCLAVNDNHVFAAQHEKAYVHIYSRQRGNQEAFVAFPERIRCLTLAGDVLVAGTAEGRLMLWETITGRLISTPPRHVQSVSCLAATPYHIISGSDDSDIHVWSLSQLLDLDAGEEHEPERSLPNHRAAIISVVASQDSNPDTSICVSASKDKSCIVWNYRTGDVLRSLLFPSFPLCVALDPASRALFSSCEDGSLYLVEFFAEKPLLGPSAEDASTVVQVASPFGMTPTDAGSASCLAVSYDGTQLLTGHPKGQILKWDVADNKTPVELANLNAAVTNLVFLSPLSETKLTSAPTIVKPAQAQRNYTLTTQFTTSLGTETRFDTLLNTPGFSQAVIENAIAALQQPTGESGKEQELAQQNEELWAIINEQRELQKQTLQKYVEAKAGRS